MTTLTPPEDRDLIPKCPDCQSLDTVEQWSEVELDHMTTTYICKVCHHIWAEVEPAEDWMFEG